MDRRIADIIIIGGGLLGTSAAYHLARKKAGKIVLLERMDVASQATSRAACLLTRARTKPVMMQLVQETYDCIERIESELGESLDLRQVGSVTAASTATSEAGIIALEEAASSFGIPCERIGQEQVKELLPWITPDTLIRSVFMPTDAYIDSALLCNGYAKAAKKLGAGIYSRTEVKDILREGNEIKGVRLANGEEIAAPVVIDAAGAWANLLSAPLGIGLPMTPVRSHFWITEVNPGLFPVEQPFAVLPDARAFTRPDVGGLIIGIREPQCVSYDPRSLAASIEHVDFTPDGGWSVLSECAAGFEPYFPGIRETGIAHYVAGPSCYVPDAQFVVGEVPEIKGFFAATGCCGAGVAAGGGIGRLVAEQVLGEATFVDSTLFDPIRFGQIDPFDPAFQRRCADARSNKKGG